jgi:hypothetical protein
MRTTRLQLLGFLLLACLFVALRLHAYEPLGHSVSNFDTQEFILAGHVPFPSAAFLTSGRTASVALLFKLVEPPAGYHITNLASPGDFISPPLADQPGLGAVSTAQSLLSVLSWLALASVVFRQVRHPLVRFVGPLLILTFGLAPQSAEWDYVLMSESLSLSLLVLLLALSLELTASLVQQKPRLQPATIWLSIFWLLVLAAWLFARDSNAYFVLVLLPVLLAVLLARKRLGMAHLSKLLVACLLALAALFYVQNHTAQASGRWVNALFNNLLAHVFPVPEHLAFFEQRGFPATPEVLALRDSNFTQLQFFEIDYLVDWTVARGSRTFVEFILTHPAWAWQTFYDGTYSSLAENTQPYFVRNPEVTPDWLVYLGDLLHPRQLSILAVVLAELTLILCLASARGSRRMALAICLFLFFAGEMATLFVSILGDASSIVRHTVGSLIPLRLSIWLLLAFILDFVLPQPSAHRK